MFSLNIIFTELRLNRRSLLIWTSVLAIVIIIYLGSFTYMEEMNVVEMIEGYPDLFTTGLGMSPEMFGDVNVYHSGLVMLYGLLLASIYAMMLAGSMVSRDSDLGTVEFLYTRPLTRTTILLSKVLSFLIMMLFLWAIAYLFSAVIGRVWVAPDNFDLSTQLLAHLMGLLACLAAGGVAFAVAPLINRVQGTTSIAIGLGFAFFIFNSLGSLYEQLRFLKYLSINHYADLTGAASGQAPVTGLIVLPLVFIAGVAIGIVMLNRKDFTD
ncbi:MAG: ABC transporter permease subunit [Bacillota bacterium]|nr:ABC transporter permease [Bacillota bacterium]MDW7730329.1 ABC transporter permease subunit [Bacillota bacterium]